MTTLRGQFLTAGSPMSGICFADSARLLLVEVINQGIRDARHGNTDALDWLNDPLVSEIAQLADLHLPKRITLDELRRRPYPGRLSNVGCTGQPARRKERI